MIASQTDTRVRVQQVIQSMEGGTAIAEQINQIENTYQTMPDDVRRSTVVQGLLAQLSYAEKNLAQQVLRQSQAQWRTMLNDHAERLLLWLMGALFIVGLFWSVFFVLGIIAALVLGVFAFRRYRSWQRSTETPKQQIERWKQVIQQIHHRMQETQTIGSEETK